MNELEDTEPLLARRVQALYTGLSPMDDSSLFDGKVDGASSGSLVYGELTTPARLFQALKLSSEDIFADLGSGRGQVVFAAAMYSVPPQMAYGIEFVADRHELAAAAHSSCQDATVCERVSLEHSDALTHPCLLHATKLFLCNATFE